MRSAGGNSNRSTPTGSPAPTELAATETSGEDIVDPNMSNDAPRKDYIRPYHFHCGDGHPVYPFEDRPSSPEGTPEPETSPGLLENTVAIMARIDRDDQAILAEIQELMSLATEIRQSTLTLSQALRAEMGKSQRIEGYLAYWQNIQPCTSFGEMWSGTMRRGPANIEITTTDDEEQMALDEGQAAVPREEDGLPGSAPIVGNMLATQREMPEQEEVPAQEEAGKSRAGPSKGRRRSSGYKIVADDKDRTRFRFVEVSESDEEESEQSES